MKLVKTINDFKIYELTKRECDANYRVYPLYVCWHKTNYRALKNMRFVEYEAETLNEMICWCNTHSEDNNNE